MSDGLQPPRTFRAFLLGGGLLVAALGAAMVMRQSNPSAPQPNRQPTRPIVQIVRQQPGLPDLADVIDRLCPSVAVIVTHDSDIAAVTDRSAAVPAVVFSDQGWLSMSSANLPDAPLDAVFSDGRRLALTDLRTDPVSGLAIARVADTVVVPVAFSDQAFPRVGQFGFALSAPAGNGCAAGTTMIGSDFLADGGSIIGYVRLQSNLEGFSPGTPLIGTDGRVLGIGSDDPPGAVIPAPIASIILDELVRNSLSASTSFGFRAIDYAAPIATRLGNVRSGAGVALVRMKSTAAKAGLRAGDIVTAVSGEPVSSASELNRALDALPGKAVLTVQRASQQLTLTIARSPA